MHEVQKQLIEKIEGKYPYKFIEGQLCINADCLEIMDLMDDKSVDLLLTDPPYGMNFQSNYRKELHKKIENDIDLSWVDSYSDLCFKVLKDNTHFYSFISFHKVDIFKQSIEKKFSLKNILIWEKNNTGMGDLKGDYAPKYELIIFSHKGYRELNNGRDSNILKFSRTQNELHPTEKPIDLFSYLINKSTEENELILDCFAGSFTTAVASYKTGRYSICIEKDEDYYRKAIERVKKETRQREMF